MILLELLSLHITTALWGVRFGGGGAQLRGALRNVLIKSFKHKYQSQNLPPLPPLEKF